ncbi:MAG: GIY-YIG nuclease family protein [Candidatus Omnitrophota bacterium]|jgi:hypothetical protein
MPRKRPNKVLIYTLSDPITGDIRYVGKTVCDLIDRLYLHLYFAKKGNKTHRCNWIRSLLRFDIIPLIEEIERIDLNGDWASRERYWIKYYKLKGFKLTNATDGGEGCHGIIHDEEFRNKISFAHKGKVISDEQKAKQSLAMKGKIVTNETRRKISEAGKGRIWSESSKKKVSDKKRGIPLPQIACEKNGRAKLNREQVSTIKKSNLSYGKLSSIYGVVKSQIARIKTGQQWAET